MSKRLLVEKEVIDTGWRQCNKKAYTKREAQEVANAALFSGRVKKMKIYPCPQGDHWHVAHVTDLEVNDKQQ